MTIVRILRISRKKLDEDFKIFVKFEEDLRKIEELSMRNVKN